MNKLTKLVLPLSLMAAALTGAVMAQDTPAPPQPDGTASRREAMMARRQVMQRLTTDFRTAIQNGSLSAEDRQRAEAALAQVQPRARSERSGAVDPQARRASMQQIQQMSGNPALRAEDRQVLAKDLADLQALRHRKS